MSKGLVYVTAIALMGLAGYVAFLAGAIVNRGYDWREMDWNRDGRTQVHEVIAAGDIVPYKTIQGGRRCVHYFAYSRGALVRTDCGGKDA